MASIISQAPAVSHVVSGKILHKESRRGLGKLLIDLFDLDQWADPEAGDVRPDTRDASSIARDPMSIIGGDIAKLYTIGKRVGNATTKASGEFLINLTARDFNLPRRTEQKPDLILLVLAPDEPGLDLNKRLLHFSLDIRFNACSNESHVILLPSSLLREKGVPFGEQTEASEETIRRRVDAYVDERNREREYDAGAAEYHGALAAKETRERKLFRASFINQITTDLATVPLRGVIASEGDNIRTKNDEVLTRGIMTANGVLGDTNTQGVPVNLYITPAQMRDLAPLFANPIDGYVDIPGEELQDVVLGSNGTENPGTLLIHNNPIAAFCATQSEDERCAKLHTDLAHEHAEPVVPGTTPAAADAITDDHVLMYADRLLRDMPAPDVVLQPELANKRQGQGHRGRGERVLPAEGARRGARVLRLPCPADRLRPRVAAAVRRGDPQPRLHGEHDGEGKFGIDAVVNPNLMNGVLATDLFVSISPVEVPGVVARFFDITREEYNEMASTNREQLELIANKIDECTVRDPFSAMGFTIPRSGSTITDLRIIQSLTEQGERLIDAVRHDDYYTLHKTLRDLHAG